MLDRRNPRVGLFWAGMILLLVVCERPASAQVNASVARQLQETFASVAAQVRPSVVRLDVTVHGAANPMLLGAAPRRQGMGSGVIFDTSGAILTNNHVIEGARAISVRLHDGRVFPATVVGRDPSTDLAVLRVPVKGLPAATFGDSDQARVGQWVLAVGSPFGLEYSVTTGVLSAKGRGAVGVNAVEDYLQTDASINPGNSGGPLVDIDGRVLGINTMVVSRGQGIGLAVPSQLAERVAKEILAKGHVERAWMGVGVQDLTPQLAAQLSGAPPRGALVNSVTPNGPASAANVRPGDVVTSIDGAPIDEGQDLMRTVFRHAVGDTLKLEIVRGGARYQTSVSLGRRASPSPSPLPMQQASTGPGLGLSIRDRVESNVGPGQRPAVAQLVSVVTGSPGDRAGLRAGDVILEADGTDRPSAAEVARAAQDGKLLCRVRRGAAVFYAAVSR